MADTTENSARSPVEAKSGRRHSQRDVSLIKRVKTNAADIVEAAVELGADEDDVREAVDEAIEAVTEGKVAPVVFNIQGDAYVTETLARPFSARQREHVAPSGEPDAKAVSLSEREQRVRRAFAKLYPSDEYTLPSSDKRPWLSDVYDGYAIACADGIHYRVEYTETADGVTFTDRARWQKVEREWVTKSLDDLASDDAALVTFGGAVKALGDGKVAGHLVLFSTDNDPDLAQDFFNQSTDYALDAQPTKTAVYYQHGLDPVLKRRRLGQGELHTDAVGVWIEAQLNMRDDYERAVYEMAKAGKLGWSSGTAAHLVEREARGKAMWIKSWPLGLDASLTPTPAEPRTRAIPLKSLTATPLAALTGPPGAEPAQPVLNDAAKEYAMTEQVTTAAAPTVQVLGTGGGQSDEVKGLASKVDAMSDLLNRFMQHMEDEPAIRKSGYFSQDGGKADKNIKSFGDWLISVYRGDETRLKGVYGSMKDMLESTGTQGGFLVPEEYIPNLLQVTAVENGIVSRVQRVPVRSAVGKYPALDQYVAPTAGGGDTAFAGGIVAATRAEGASFGETQATFKQLEWRLKSIGGYTEVSNELVADSAIAIETLLTGLFRVAIASKTERHILRGTGAGEPLGILNAPCLVQVTPGTNSAFTWVDVTNMFSRFRRVTNNTAWLIHPGVWPDVGSLEISTGGGGVYQANLSAGLGNNLLGYPIIASEHLPQDDNSGDVILADLGTYLLFDRGGLSIAFSEHAAFTRGMGTWRFEQRLDGMPWLAGTITLADPQGSFTSSTFVSHND